jgi:hypothetical protein
LLLLTVVPGPNQKPVVSIVLNEDSRPGDEPGTLVVEQVVFEMNIPSSQWRRIRRKRVIRQSA